MSITLPNSPIRKVRKILQPVMEDPKFFLD